MQSFYTVLDSIPAAGTYVHIKYPNDIINLPPNWGRGKNGMNWNQGTLVIDNSNPSYNLFKITNLEFISEPSNKHDIEIMMIMNPMHTKV